MANRSRSNFLPVRVARGPRRETVWFEFGIQVISIDTSGVALASSLNAAALSLRPFTIIRSRFEVLLFSDQKAASETQAAGLGFAVVSDQAVAIGVTAVPTPLTDLGSDLWFVLQLMMARFELVSAVGVDGNVGQHYTIDSKAMRKVDVGQDLVETIEVSSASGGTTIVTGGRMLIKLH